MRLIPHSTVPAANDTKRLSYIVQQAFNQRRKTLRNSLKNVISADELAKLDIDAQKRAEELTVAEFVRISNYLC